MIDEFTNQIKTLQKYRKRIKIIPEGLKTIGSGIYIHRERETLIR